MNLREIGEFELKIRRKEIYGSFEIARATLILFKWVVEQTAEENKIPDNIIKLAKLLRKHLKNQDLIKNICDQLINKLDEEIESGNGELRKSQSGPRPSFLSIFSRYMPKKRVQSAESYSIRTSFRDYLNMFIENLESSYENIAKSAPSFLHYRDVVLTLGYSNSILKFLNQQKLKLTVIIPERAPEYDGHIMAAKLRECKINVIVIPDTCLFAVLPKITKIIVPAQTVYANGGILGYSLTGAIALAAKHYSTPFIVLYWQMKLSPLMPYSGKSISSLHRPDNVMPENIMKPTMTVPIAPEGDYVPPELITLMINEESSHCPSNTFQLIQSLYEHEAQ